MLLDCTDRNEKWYCQHGMIVTEHASPNVGIYCLAHSYCRCSVVAGAGSKREAHRTHQRRRKAGTGEKAGTTARRQAPCCGQQRRGPRRPCAPRCSAPGCSWWRAAASAGFKSRGTDCAGVAVTPATRTCGRRTCGSGPLGLRAHVREGPPSASLPLPVVDIALLADNCAPGPSVGIGRAQSREASYNCIDGSCVQVRALLVACAGRRKGRTHPTRTRRHATAHMARPRRGGGGGGRDVSTDGTLAVAPTSWPHEHAPACGQVGRWACMVRPRCKRPPRLW